MRRPPQKYEGETLVSIPDQGSGQIQRRLQCICRFHYLGLAPKTKIRARHGAEAKLETTWGVARDILFYRPNGQMGEITVWRTAQASRPRDVPNEVVETTAP